MSLRHLAPAAQWTEPASRARLWTPVYPLYDPLTDELGWNDAGPATCALVYNEGTREIGIDDDPSAPGALRCLMDAAGNIHFDA